MKLTDLEPQFLRYVVTPAWPTQIVNDPLVGSESGFHIEFRDRVAYHYVETLAEAQGVWFGCPRCFVNNGNSMIGTHHVCCWSLERGAPPQAASPGHWRLDGTGYNDLTLNAEPPNNARSVLLTGPGCGAHFHVTNGEVTFA